MAGLPKCSDAMTNLRATAGDASSLGPHYTMLGHKPADTVTLSCRGVRLPERTPETFAAWNSVSIRGHACFWRDFPEALRTVLPKLGWS